MSALQETVLQRFVENATAARDCATLSDSFEKAVKAFGFNQYAYLQLPAPDTVEESVHLSNYPGNWIEHYADECYQFVDPVLHQTIRSRVPFDWQTPWFMRKRDELRGFFDEAGDVGIKSGLTIPFHKGDRPAAALSITSEETPAEANKILEEYGDTLHLLGMYFYIHVERVLCTPPTGRLFTLPHANPSA